MRHPFMPTVRAKATTSALLSLLGLTLLTPSELAAQQAAPPNLPTMPSDPAAAPPSIGAAPATPGVPQLTGNCDLLSSDTVRAVFHEITSDNTRDYIARFEVVELLAHQDGASAQTPPLRAGDIVDVLLRRDIPGQPAGILEDLVSMKQGQLAVMRLDRLFMLDPQDYGERLVCARFRPLTDSTNTPAGSASASAAGPAAGDKGHAPDSLTQSHGKVTTKIEVNNDGSIRERIFVNGEEILPPEVQTIESEAPSPRGNESDAIPSQVLPEDDSSPNIRTLPQPASHYAPARGRSISISGSSH